MQDDSSSEDGSGKWDDWKSDVPPEPIVSLVGPHTLSSASDAWKELYDAIGFDYATFASARKLDGYARVRLINHLRRAAAAHSGDCVALVRAALDPSVLASGSAIWTDDSLLVPVLPDDPLVMDAAGFDEDDDDDSAGEGIAATTGEDVRAAAAAFNAAALAAATTVAPLPDSSASDTVAGLRAELSAARALLASLAVADEDEDVRRRRRSSSSGSSGEGVGANAGAAGRRRPRAPQDNDTYYFNSYARSGIHAVSARRVSIVSALVASSISSVFPAYLHPERFLLHSSVQEMLKDAVRTEAYRAAILRNGSAFAGRSVLDLGCGTGILSMFSATAGAARVVALDASDVSRQ
jgi:hypothetical protein